jgi:hypothetical protein
VAEIVTLELPEDLALRVRDIATRTQRRLEDMLIEWIDHAATDPPLELLPDSQILALCELQMDVEQQDELGDLLARNREGLLDETERQRLDELMQVYRRGLVRKAQALQIAVARGLKAPLNQQ